MIVVSVAFLCLKSVILRSLMIRDSVVMFFGACSETGNNFACFFIHQPLLLSTAQLPEGAIDCWCKRIDFLMAYGHHKTSVLFARE